MFDPDTVEGDYAEAYQRWTHHYRKSSDKIEECFKESAFVPFISIEEALPSPNWKKLVQSLINSQKDINDL
jgi:hypothetical protein